MNRPYAQNGYVIAASDVQVNKVLRNTYMLLALTLAFSAITAGIAMAINLPYGAGLIMSLVALALIWFVLPRTANSAAGLGVVFAFTGLIGAGLGPMLNHYLALSKDRKSTRLNSSHVAISYAVFCLKKKTTILTTVF